MRNYTVKYNTDLLIWLICFGWCNVANAQQFWINEIHYNNVGDDANEFVEVALAQSYGGDLATLTIELYNGANGQIYDSHALNTFTKGATHHGFVFYYKSITNIQNTHPSGLALVLNGVAIQFISYGGTFNAVSGAAAGYTSKNMGVAENNATPLGFSLQLSGSGTRYADFSWNAPANDTPGELNINQTFSAALLQGILTDATTRQPAKPSDTISYKLEIENEGDGDANNLVINRKGDVNTTFLSGTFQSTALALPGNISTGLEDQITTLLLQGLDPDGDMLTFSIIQQPQHGALSGLSSVSKVAASVTYQPNAGFTGSDSFTFSVSDDDNNRDTSAVNITIQPVNDSPNFTPGKDVVLLEDAGQQIINNWATNVSKGASDEANQNLEFIIISNNNPALFSELPQVAPDGTLAFTTTNNANGTAAIIIQLKDNGGTANGGVDTSARHALAITVNPINDAPSFTAGQDLTILEDAGIQMLENWATNLSKGASDEATQSLEFIVLSNSNPDLFTQLPILSNNGKLTFEVKENTNGTAILILQLKDNGGTANGGVDTSDRHTLAITVNPINDAPSFTAGQDLTILEDAGIQMLENWATNLSKGASDEATQSLEFIVLSNSNPDLFTQLPILSNNGKLTFEAKENINGSAIISLQLKDNGGTANGGIDTSARHTLTITINPVNDAPNFTKGSDIVLKTTPALQTFEGWATDITAGFTDEAIQIVTFVIENNDNPTLFAETPQISATGTLTFKPAEGATGIATITIKIMDDGGTANGGVDSSTSQAFKITLEPAE